MAGASGSPEPAPTRTPGRSPPIQDALQEFAGAVTAKSSALAGGGPEDQLRGPFEHLLVRVAAAWGEGVVCTGEAPLPGRLGRPDYAVHRGGVLTGYVELKAPGAGADAARFKGRDRTQFRRFSAIPNLLYSDGNEWALYRGGERAGRIVRLAGDVASDGRRAVGAEEGGVVSFVTASSWLDGDAFGGMREHLRRVCDEVWILDLGGEGRGTRRSGNVFAIRTPVAIAVAFRAKGAGDETRPAVVRYVRIEGSREEKLSALGAVEGFGGVAWRDCAGGWQAPFRPAGEGEYFGWPLLTDLMPWQHSGVQFKRTWPIAPDAETLGRRWRALLACADPAERARAFKETRDRTIGFRPPPLSEDGETGRPIAGLPRDAPAPRVERYAYRSFDRQWILVDTRLGDYLRPDLWRVHGARQVYLTSLLYHPLDGGPALTACAHVPDLHHFSGRGQRIRSRSTAPRTPRRPTSCPASSIG